MKEGSYTNQVPGLTKESKEQSGINISQQREKIYEKCLELEPMLQISQLTTNKENPKQPTKKNHPRTKRNKPKS